MAFVLKDHPSCNLLCSACHYKHLSYEAQLQQKQRWAEAKLERWQEVLRPIIPAPEGERLGYRSKVWLRVNGAEFSWDLSQEEAQQEVQKEAQGSRCAEQENSNAADEGPSFGVYRAVQKNGKWGDEWIAKDQCPLHSLAVQAILGGLKSKLSQDAPRFVTEVWLGVWFGPPHLVLVAKGAVGENLWDLDWGGVLQPPFTHVWLHVNAQLGRRVFAKGPMELLFASNLGAAAEVVPPVGVFQQVAQSLLTKARAEVVEALLEGQPTQVLDLYCGSGELAELIPNNIGWIGIEFSSAAVAYANRVKNSMREAFAGRVEHRLNDPKVFQRVEKNGSIFLNPPRSGLSEEARDRLARLIQERLPSTLVYLSCSASRLAVDLATFEVWGYQVEKLQPFDFFPQTEHFEILAVLRRDVGT